MKELNEQILKRQKTNIMQATGNQVIDGFIIEASLITPVSKIINGLNNKEFRDCDIKWLNTKLENFTKFACETLAIEVQIASDFETQRETILNDFVISKFLNRFNVLLEYFKTI